MLNIIRNYIIVGLILLALPGAVAAEEMTPMQETFHSIGFGVLRDRAEAPGFSLKDLNGNQVSLADFQGSVVLINVWATWCPACVQEKDSMQSLYDHYREDAFELLTVAMPDGRRETEETLRDYMNDNNYTFPVLLDSQGEVFMRYSGGSVPVSWVIDTEGNLVARQMGARDWNSSQVRQALKDLMEE